MKNYKSLSSNEKRDFWAKHINAWKKSGQSQAKYCKEQDITKSALGYWNIRLTKEKRLVEIPSALIEIESNSTINIWVCNNICLQVKRGFDPELLLKTVRTLEQLS